MHVGYDMADGFSQAEVRTEMEALGWNEGG